LLSNPATNALAATLNTGDHILLSNFSSSNEAYQHQQQQQLIQQQQHLQQQQQQAASNVSNSLSQLISNINTPPSLVVYIIDPFDYYLYCTEKLEKRNESSKHQMNNNNIKKEPISEDKSDYEMDDENDDDQSQASFDEHDLKRLRLFGFYKAYLEFYNQLPDLFKYSTQFQILPLNLINDVQEKATSMYVQSLIQQSTSNSNYSNCYSGGFGTGWSDLDTDFKLSLLKSQAFNTFAISKRFFMSPAHNYYLNLMNNSSSLSQQHRPKSLTGFGPAAYEEKCLKEMLLASGGATGSDSCPISSFNQLKKMQFYSPPFILAPTTITNQAVSLAASNMIFKNMDVHRSQQQNNNNLNWGECNQLMPHFIQLSMSNSLNGFLNKNNNYNFNLTDLIHQQQSQLSTHNPLLANQLLNNGQSSQVTGSNSVCSYLTAQPHQQQSNVLYVGYCLSEDQRYLLTSCCDENGELIESTSIYIEVDERLRRKESHARRIALRKLWEFVIAIISQTCKPWRLVIGRLGRMGHSELRGWGCLLSKKNLQRVCHLLKETCYTCNVLGNMEMPCILSACLISFELNESICVYPESYSREDKIAAAALTGQQYASNHASQSHGVSCTHILTFPVSAIIQTCQMANNALKDGDPLSKPDEQMDDSDFFSNFFKFTEEEEEMTDLLNDNDKPLNESGPPVDGDHNNTNNKYETLLNQEELIHLDQQPLAVGYYISTAKCGPLPKWLRGDISLDSNFHTFKATLHINNRYALENDELIMQMKTEISHKLDSSATSEVLRYVLERYNALSWLNIDPLMQDRKSCLPIHHTILLQMYYAFKNYI